MDIIGDYCFGVLHRPTKNIVVNKNECIRKKYIGFESTQIQHVFCQWEFQDPKLEVPTIYKAYIRPKFQGISPQHMAQNIVLTYLHLRILKFPLIWGRKWITQLK